LSKLITIDIEPAGGRANYQLSIPVAVRPSELQLSALLLLEYNRAMMAGVPYDRWKQIRPDQVAWFETAIEALTLLVKSMVKES